MIKFNFQNVLMIAVIGVVINLVVKQVPALRNLGL